MKRGRITERAVNPAGNVACNYSAACNSCAVSRELLFRNYAEICNCSLHMLRISVTIVLGTEVPDGKPHSNETEKEG